MANLTRADMEALLPDNTTGDISAKDLRDIVGSVLTLAEDVPQNGVQELNGANPVFKMGVLTGGLAAQMQVIDKETGREVATMEWHKATQTFNFVLFDKDSGVAKNSLSITPDGEATLHGKKILTENPNSYNNHTYDHDTGSNIIIKSTNPTVPPNPDGYTPLAKIQETRDAGIYEIKISKTFQHSLTGKSAIFRWTLNGGAITPNWEIFPIEVKDKTNRMSESYVFPYIHTGGDINIQLEAKREANSGTLTIDFANVIFERKH